MEAEEQEGEGEKEDVEDPKKKKEREKREPVTVLEAFAKEYVEEQHWQGICVRRMQENASIHSINWG